MAIQIQLRRGTATNWFTANPILAVGEMAIESDSDRYKLGNGINRWNELTYGGFVGQGNDPSNWNTNMTLGLYYVNRTSWSGTVGSPTDAYGVGLLQVLISGEMVVQKYQPNDTSSLVGSEFVRTKVIPDSWTNWSRTIGDTGSLDGGTF